MTERNVTHAMFTLERTYEALVAKVWAAFATEEGKRRWFGGEDQGWTMLERAFDFREGGRERDKGRWHTGMVSDFQAHYHEIIEGERIVYAYDMFIDDVRISVSLATIEFAAEGKGTRLRLTEQGAFLDGYDDAGSRERGTAGLLEALRKAVETEAADA